MKYISPSYVAETVSTLDVICTSNGAVTVSKGTIQDNAGNTYEGVIAEVDFNSLFGNN